MFAPLLPGGCGYLYILWFLWFLCSGRFYHFHYCTDRAVCTTLHSTKLDFREARIPEARFPRIISTGSPVSENAECRKLGFLETAARKRGREGKSYGSLP